MDAEIERIAIIDNPLSIHSVHKNDRTVPYPLHEMRVNVKKGRVFGIKFTYQNLLNGSYKVNQLKMILAHLFGESGPNANRWVNLGSNLKKSLIAEQILILVFIRHSETFRDMDLSVPQVGTFEIPAPAKRQRTLVAIKPKPVRNTNDFNERMQFEADFKRKEHNFFKRISIIATTTNSCLKFKWLPTPHKTFIKISKSYNNALDCIYVYVAHSNGTSATYQPIYPLRCIDISQYVNDPIETMVNIICVHCEGVPAPKYMAIEVFTMGAPPASDVPMIDDRDVFCVNNNDESEDICITEFKLSSLVLCPITYTRMSVPVRSVKCKHLLQFFDYDSFVSVGARKCPVCQIPIEFDHLCKSRYISELLESNPGDFESESQPSEFIEID